MTDSDRYVVISADTHGGTEPPGYREHLDPAFRGDYDTWLADEFPAIRGSYLATVEQATRTWGADEEGPHTDAFVETMQAGMGSAADRVRMLEADGVVASVIYPGASILCSPPFAPGAAVFGTQGTEFSRAHRVAGVRAYNRWLADYCGEYPQQLFGVIKVVDYTDLDEAVGLIREAAEAGLRGGIEIPPLRVSQPGLHDRYWDLLWDVCESYSLPVNVHASIGIDPGIFGNGDAAMSTAMAFATAENFRSMAFKLLVLGGVFERHPGLRLVFSEQYADWIPLELEQMEVRFAEGFGMEMFRSSLSLTPRGYWERNCGVGATFMTPKEAGMRHEIGLSTIMWGSDFPHPEGTYPFTRESLRLSFSAVPEDDLRAILGGNAARIYGFDLAALRPIANRVGPTVEDLATPLTELPQGFRRFSVRPDEDRDLVLQD
jgi:predicted TIM-barrel fold metal-dependent hydrolase